MLFGCTVTPDSEETKLKSSNPEASVSGGKISGVLSGSCSARKCIHAAISGGVTIFKVPPRSHLLRRMSSL